jgi:phenylacetate-CoA ligase
MPFVPRSEFPDVVWPALVSGSRANTLAVLAQLLQTQWWPAEELRRWQLRQVHALLTFAQALPHVRQAAQAAGWSPAQPIDAATWQRIPILTRQQARELGDSLFAPTVPPTHGQIIHDATSGSTGTPLNVRRTALFSFLYQAIGLREMIWHDRDVSQTYALIKHVPGLETSYPEGATLEDWGGAAGSVYATGTAKVLDIRTPIDQMAEWVRRIAPAYLNSFPSAIDAIVEQFAKNGWPAPPLREVRTQGEVVSGTLRQRVRNAWKVEITDCYSAEEVGYIAHQAPRLLSQPVAIKAEQPVDAQPRFLVAAETTLVEILNDQNQPCGPGEIGRVIVTPLHNFAMPLIRYEIGDFAEAGEPSPCGRGLPVIKRIFGRSRSRIVLPDGSHRFAYNPSEVFAGISVVRQYQIVQKQIDRLTVNLVVERPLETSEQRLIESGLAKSFGHAFAIDWRYVDSIPRSASGKFEDIRSELP